MRRRQQVLVFGHLADVGGDLALEVFSASGADGRRQRPGHIK